MSNRKSSLRFVIVSTLIIAISAMTASASWTDYVNPFTYFASAETAQAEPAVQVETPPALVTTVTTNGGSGLAPTYPDLASAITALNAIPAASHLVRRQLPLQELRPLRRVATRSQRPER
ncbi:MAG: hypothetical protein IPK01_14335 [Acidobacteria bacterium]|nr:hypothetical protein [Acidobacteriota bacterium]